MSTNDIEVGRPVVMSDESMMWDAKNKGHLSKAERVSKSLDEGGKGYLNQDEATKMAEQMISLAAKNKKIVRILIGMAILNILLFAGCIAASIFAVSHGKSYSANAITIEEGNTTERIACVSDAEIAKMWVDNEKGIDVRFNFYDEEGHPEMSSPLSSGDSSIEGDVVTLGGIIFEPDERCNDSAESRRLLEESGGHLESIHDHIRNLKEGRKLAGSFKWSAKKLTKGSSKKRQGGR
jgi:hypothetical protein